MFPGRPAVAAALHCAEYHSAHNDWTACRMRLHMAFTGYETCGPFATFGHTPAPYAFRGLSASGFALPWRTAVGLVRITPELANRLHRCLDMVELQAFVQSVVDAVENPDSGPLCRR